MNTADSMGGFAHAARALALGEVLSLVASHCVNARAREAVAGLRPVADVAWIWERLGEADEYRSMREAVGDIAIPDTGYRAEVERIARGNRGTGESLRRIADGEHAVGELRRAVAGRAEASPRLAAIAAAASPDDEWVAEAYRALDPDGKVRDDASPVLRAIRRDIAAARATLRERAEKLVSDLGADSHATIMGARHVLWCRGRACARGAAWCTGPRNRVARFTSNRWRCSI